MLTLMTVFCSEVNEWESYVVPPDAEIDSVYWSINRHDVFSLLGGPHSVRTHNRKKDLCRIFSVIIDWCTIALAYSVDCLLRSVLSLILPHLIWPHFIWTDWLQPWQTRLCAVSDPVRRDNLLQSFQAHLFRHGLSWRNFTKLGWLTHFDVLQTIMT